MGGELFIPTIAFSDDAIDSAIALAHALIDYTVDLDIPNNSGYPARSVRIVRIDPDGDVVVRETEDGDPVPHGGTWAVPINLIRRITVL
jgi:hypothetical protein